MCYLWTAPVSYLTPSPWSFEQFLNERLHRWVSEDLEEFDGELESDDQEHSGTSSACINE